MIPCAITETESQIVVSIYFVKYYVYINKPIFPQLLYIFHIKIYITGASDKKYFPRTYGTETLKQRHKGGNLGDPQDIR